MEVGNIKSVNEAAKTDIPHKLISVNRIMNMVGSYHLNELYGIDLSAKYHATLREERIAIDLYEEYLAYRDNYQPGDEYELMAYFAETLGLDDFFRIVPESRFTKADNLAKTFTPEEKIDPESHDEQNAAFAENNGDSNPVVTMMMTMYMQGALEYLNGMPQSDIQRLAFEIANVGVNGISPNKAYTLKSIPNREFGGYELLAYYYVSWAIAFPDKVDLLGLPFKNSYEAAKGNFGKKK